MKTKKKWQRMQVYFVIRSKNSFILFTNIKLYSVKYALNNAEKIIHGASSTIIVERTIFIEFFNNSILIQLHFFGMTHLMKWVLFKYYALNTFFNFCNTIACRLIEVFICILVSGGIRMITNMLQCTEWDWTFSVYFQYFQIQFSTCQIEINWKILKDTEKYWKWFSVLIYPLVGEMRNRWWFCIHHQKFMCACSRCMFANSHMWNNVK